MLAFMPSAVVPSAISQASFPHPASDAVVRVDPTATLVEASHNLAPRDIAILGQFGSVTSVVGPIAVLHPYGSGLESVVTLPFVVNVERSRTLTVLLDRSVPDVGADTVWREVMDSQGRNVTGEGVVVGFVDTGIDITNPDFYFMNGTTKILYVWDQTINGKPPSRFGYGYECTSIDVQNGSCPEVDTFGHGTHVAGIATSTGRATGKYTGVAPGASIIFVKSGYPLCGGSSWNFETANLLDGINYIVQQASERGMRAVISLSLGGNTGGHDGTDPLEIGLDAIVKAGTPIVVAAGNEAQDPIHVHGTLGAGTTVTVGVQTRPTTTDVVVDVWYSPLDMMNGSLNAPDGAAYSVPTPNNGTLSSYGVVKAVASNTTIGRELYFEVNSTSPMNPSTWTVTLRADRVNAGGRWDAWVDTESCGYPGATFTSGQGYAIDSSDTVGVPGTARYVITVGAYTIRTRLTADSGSAGGNPENAGFISAFSSLGPTRDGRIKPDVTAPGTIIISDRSSAAPHNNMDPDAYHTAMAGTSMATPHVAGVVALMLQYEPELNATDISAILKNTARWDEHTGMLYNGSTVWGFGKVDARTATGLIRVTVIPNGLPAGLPAILRTGGQSTATNDTWAYLYMSKGTTHPISVGAVPDGQGTRYIPDAATFQVSDTSIKTVNYTRQYLLTVNTPYGPPTGNGWYDMNSNVTVQVPSTAAARDWRSIFGENYVFNYFTENGKPVSMPLLMSEPRDITAVYSVAYAPQALLLPLASVLVLALTVLALKSRRIDRDQSAKRQQ
jgi:subtilisin family serine protease